MSATLLLGDALAMTLLTLLGFASHGELRLAFGARFLVNLSALLIAWFPLAFALGLFSPEPISARVLSGRVMLTALYAMPLATFLRALVLNTTVFPAFTLVLTATTMAGMLLWRLSYAWGTRRLI